MQERLRSYLLQVSIWYAAGVLLVLLVAMVFGKLPAVLSARTVVVLAIGFFVAAAAGWWLPRNTASTTDEWTGRSSRARKERTDAIPPLTDTAKSSVAVLPLENLSPDDEDDVLARGLSAEIIRVLSGLPDLRVVSHLQTLVYGHADLARIRSDLQVRYVLSGSVQRDGDRLRVIAMLSDAVAGSQVWSRTYDRRIDDLFAIQSEIAEAIAVETNSSYMIESSLESRAAEPRDLSAWGLTHKAYNFWILSYNREGSEEALSLLEQALRLEPDYAVAHAVKGFVLNQRVLNAFCDDPQREVRESLAAMERAYQLAPRDPLVMEYAGLVFHNCGLQHRALAVLKVLVEKSPYDLIAWGYLGMTHVWGGADDQVTEGMAILSRLPKMAPNHPSLPFWHYFLAIGFGRQGKWEMAREHARIATTIHPGFCMAWFTLANALCELGDRAAAQDAETRALAANPNFAFQDFADYIVAVSGEWIGYEAQFSGLAREGMVEVRHEPA